MVWICTACKNNRHKYCDSKWKCDCDCNIGGVADTTQKGLAIGGGAVLAIGGIALTIFTGGLGAVLAGGVMLGAGISSTWNGAEKAIKKERINGKTYVADVAFGAVTGIATGGIGAAGETIAANVVKQGAKEVAKAGAKKLVIRAATGVATGVVAKTIDEVKQCSTTEKKFSDFGKSFDANGNESGTVTAWATSALVGGLGGASTHLSSNLTKQVTNGVAKSATRIAVTGTTAAVSDATVQGMSIASGKQEKYDVKRTVTSATVSTIMAAAQEGTKNAIYRANGGKYNMLADKHNEKAMKKLSEQDKQAAREGLQAMKNIPQQTLDEGRRAAEIRTKLDDTHRAQTGKMKDCDAQIKQVNALKQYAQKVGDVSKVKEYSQQNQQLKAVRKEIGQDIARTEQNIGQHSRKMLDGQNTHFLDKEKFGQVACDLNQPSSTARGPSRLVVDHTTGNTGRSVFLYSDHTSTHDYQNTPGFGQGDCYRDYTKHTNILKATNEAVNNFMCNDALRNKEEEETEN